MKRLIMNLGIVKSFRTLKGNARVAVLFEPMWGIPFNLYNFYLSLYMKSMGVTDRQIGYLISIGFIASSVLSLFAGVITDRLGRKKTTLIFDFIAWPVAIFIYMISNNFWMFALASVANSFVRIVSISWNLLNIEDSDSEQRVNTFNLMNIINLSSGILVPLAGPVVQAFGLVTAERIFMAFAIISMSTMIFLRNRKYTETATGQRILEEYRKRDKTRKSYINIFGGAINVIKQRPEVILVMGIVILYNLYIPIGSYSSLYFAPYMTEAVGLGKSTVSLLGGIYSTATLLVFVFVNPIINRYNRRKNMLVGLILQSVAILSFIILPRGILTTAVASIIMLAVGFSIYRPLIDSLLADSTEGDERANLYALMNTVTFVLTSVMGALSGYLYDMNPKLIYVLSLVILALCTVLLLTYLRINRAGKTRLAEIQAS